MEPLSSDFICNFATRNKIAMSEAERKQIRALVNREVIPVMGNIGSEGMNETDKLVLQIMTNKC